MSKDHSTEPRTIRERMLGVWRRTDRARAIAQIPVVALSPAVGPVANQVRLSPPPELTAMRRAADLDQQKQWAHQELQQIEGRAYVVRDNVRGADPAAARTDRDRAAHERDR
jgi:hypothetical protein